MLLYSGPSLYWYISIFTLLVPGGVYYIFDLVLVEYPVYILQYTYCTCGRKKLNAWRARGARAWVSVNFHKFSPCMAGARRARGFDSLAFLSLALFSNRQPESIKTEIFIESLDFQCPWFPLHQNYSSTKFSIAIRIPVLSSWPEGNWRIAPAWWPRAGFRKISEKNFMHRAHLVRACVWQFTLLSPPSDKIYYSCNM
jgi:hypothetical protein